MKWKSNEGRCVKTHLFFMPLLTLLLFLNYDRNIEIYLENKIYRGEGI